MRRKQTRSGLLIRGQRGNAEVRVALIRFARWARRHFEFPIRLPVYLNGKPRFRTSEGQWVTASFFAPFSREVEPYIRIATGDFLLLRKAKGRNNALAAFIHSLCHELVHYQQWLETGKTTERGVVRRAASILQEYADDARRP